MRKTIYIVDPVCIKYYDTDLLKTEGVAANESYLLYNLTEIINHKKVSNYQIIFFQDTREKKVEYNAGNNNTIIFEPLNMIVEYENLDPETIILRIDPKLLNYFNRLYPTANLILYCHDFDKGGNLKSIKKELNGIYYDEVNIDYVTELKTNKVIEKWLNLLMITS